MDDNRNAQSMNTTPSGSKSREEPPAIEEGGGGRGALPETQIYTLTVFHKPMVDETDATSVCFTVYGCEVIAVTEAHEQTDYPSENKCIGF